MGGARGRGPGVGRGSGVGRDLGVGRGSGLAPEPGQRKAPGAERVGWARGPSEGSWENPGVGLRVSEVREGSGGGWTLRREVWV